MLIKTLVVTPFQQNARVLIDLVKRESIIIDPGGEALQIFRAAEADRYACNSVALTHSHIDHAAGVADLFDIFTQHSFGMPKLYGSQIEQVMRQRIGDQAIMFGLSRDEYRNSPEPDLYIKEGDNISFGAYHAKIFDTPGHSPGHVVLFFEKLPYVIQQIEPHSGLVMFESKGDAPILIAGDTVFAGSIGRSDLPGGDHQVLLQSIKEKILILPEDTVILSGHGPDTTVGQEKRTNPFLR